MSGPDDISVGELLSLLSELRDVQRRVEAFWRCDLDRLDSLNLARFCAAMSEGILEQTPEESDGNREDLSLRDYASQPFTMAEALREHALNGGPLDFSPGSFLDDHTGVDYIDVTELT